ncbi:hypothetical protein SASPL_144510 [Salvia splendens]|uniref:Pentatricopeptide repeat-containing protein n=1 Tax=Salvia splendens TaxID=180675 RepID=A0A8X8WFY6_SALSN|nr:hypothetical protein SASPL_144510 [Salvia splendens]
MQAAGIPPDYYAFPAALKAATALQDLRLGKQIHASLVKLGFNFHATVSNTEWELALEAFRLMWVEKIEPSSFNLVSVALACSNLKWGDGLRLGKQLHGYSLRVDERKTFTDNSLMAMYAKLGRVDDARIIFECFAHRDMVSWNTIISAFSQSDRFYEGLECFRGMNDEGFKPDGVTISSVLPACSHLELLDLGKEIHAFVVRNDGFMRNSFVTSALVDMYCNCKQVASGRRVFDIALDRKLATWNAMFAGYAQNGFYLEAVRLFMKSMVVSGLFPNPTTVASVLPACVHCEAFFDKEVMQGYVLKLGLGSDRYVQNALMDLYSRVGKVDVAEYIFHSMESKDIVSYNTMITGYMVCGYHEDALILLHEMQTSEKNVEVSFRPNSVTLMTILPGCATLAALAKGKEIYAYAFRNGLESDVAVGSALVDMYAKCGCLVMARRVFKSMPNRNVITWNAMILACGMHGEGDGALALFRKIAAEVKPNEVTFIAVFAACCHSGLVDEGKRLFQTMKVDHGVEPIADHYACVVDLLGRGGRLDEAHDIINSMPVGLDKISASNLFTLEANIASHYVLLSNIYSSAGLWEKANEVRGKMKSKRLKKEPGCSWIEYSGEVHKFVAGDTKPPQSEQWTRI